MNLRESLSNIEGAVEWNWQRLGESAALGPAVAWSYLPLGLLGPALLEPNRVGGSTESWVVVGLGGQAAIFVSLWISRRLIHRKSISRSRPLANLAAILIAIGLRGVSIDWLAQIFKITDSFDLSYRLSAGLFTQTGILVTVAVIVSSFSFHRQLVAKLWRQEEQLRELNSSMQNRLSGTRSALAAQVRLTIDPLIKKMYYGLERVVSPEDSEKIRDSIREIVDERLRPLSRELESQVDIEAGLPAISSGPSTIWIALPSRLPLSLLMRPFATSFFVALLAASPGLIVNGIAGAVVYPLVAFILTAPILVAVRALIGSWKLPLWWGIPFVFVLTAVVVGGVRLFAAERILLFPNTSILISLIGGGLAGTIAAMYAIADERRSSIEQDLDSSIEELQVKLSILRQHEFVTRRELSYILHGSVQSALNVAAMRLASTAKPDARLLNSIRRDIEIATARLDAPASADALLIDTLSDIAELWDGTCSVKWTLDHKTIRRLVDFPVAATCIAEITRECIGNAIRHGHATEVRITITVNEDRITFTSLDNGTVQTDWDQGMGSRMMNEMCLSWSHSKEPEGTRVTAEIATSAI
jgi:hypothetical protein